MIGFINNIIQKANLLLSSTLSIIKAILQKERFSL